MLFPPPEKRPQTKPNRAKKLKSTYTEAGSSNKGANPGTLKQQNHRKSKTKIMNQGSDSKPCKMNSFSLSQPACSANPTSSRNVLRSWQPPLKKFCYDCVTEKTDQNLWLQDITPSKNKVCDDNVRNGQTAMDSTDTDAKVHAENMTFGCNEDDEEDKSLSQQSTQIYVHTENERDETQGEKHKYEGNEEEEEVENIEIDCTVQAAGKEPVCSYVHVTNSSDISAGHSDPDPLSTRSNDDGKTFFTNHSEEMDQCLIPIKHMQNEDNQVSTKDKDKEQDMSINVQEGSGNNIMNKSDSTVLPPDKKIIPLMFKHSECEESKIKPSYDSVMCHMQSLTAKMPQHMNSKKTFIRSEEESLLLPDLVLKDLIHSQLTGDTNKETKLTEGQAMSPAATTIKISEQKSETNKCEGKGYTSEDILKAHDETAKNDNSLLLATEAEQIASSSGNETECQEPNILTNDLKVNKPKIPSVKMIESGSPSGAAKVPEIYNVNNIKLRTHKESDAVETITPKVLSDTDLNTQPETSKVAMNICDAKHMVQTNTDTENVRNASWLLDMTAEDHSKSLSALLTAANASSEDYSKSPTKPLTAANISSEQDYSKSPSKPLSTENVSSEQDYSNSPSKPLTEIKACSKEDYSRSLSEPITAANVNSEQDYSKGPSKPLTAANASSEEDYSKSLSEPLIAENLNSEQHLTERHTESSNTVPYPTVSTKYDMAKPGTDLNKIYGNCFKHPVTNIEHAEGGAQVGNTEPPSTVHPSTSKSKESLPKPEEINLSEGYFYKLKDIYCKSPSIAMEAPNILENAPKTNENILTTASHNYLLDDDIGLTGSQLLRIENECQYKVQRTEGVHNYASFCGEATVPDTAVFAPKLPPPNWAQIIQEKRQKLRSIIQDISRLK
jgi:hypothetical protein